MEARGVEMSASLSEQLVHLFTGVAASAQNIDPVHNSAVSSRASYVSADSTAIAQIGDGTTLMNLERLVLDGVQVGNAGACVVMGSAAVGGCLEVLSMRACGIGPQCSSSLEQLVHRSCTLRKLDLDLNK